MKLLKLLIFMDNVVGLWDQVQKCWWLLLTKYSFLTPVYRVTGMNHA